jgi:uncharacterized lipoprotein YddW (UPF0748 family)
VSTGQLTRRHWALGSAATLAAGWVSTGLAGCAHPTRAAAATDRPAVDTPTAPREFRAAWVATVANIDWPSRPGLTSAQQQDEVLRLLDCARDTGLNAVVLQVRPAADALYASAIEPWSEYLSGEQGRAPAPFYDPLAFWVDEAHRRGLQLHAWFNPYRARQSSARSAPAPNHLSVSRPEIVKTYGDQLWLDPGEPAAFSQTLAVVRDVVARYDIDGVQIDDYFYPYPLAVPGGGELAFPDAGSYQRHLDTGGTLSLEDWRRDNVNRLVRAFDQAVHQIKPWVLVGISPFGLGKPALRPPGIQGFSQYDKLYADVEHWLAQGWLDYLAPQLYWPLDRTAQAFAVLLDYWLARNSAGRHVWPGLYSSSVGRADKPWPAAEIVNQVAELRQRPGADGHLHFSMVALLQDRDGLATRLKAGAYAQAALPPATPWLASGAIGRPSLSVDAADPGLARLAPGAGDQPALWAVWRRSAEGWRFEVLPGQARSLPIGSTETLVVSAVDRCGIESERSALQPG